MSDLKHRRYNMFLRGCIFDEDNATDFPANSAGKRNFDELNKGSSMMENVGVRLGFGTD